MGPAPRMPPFEEVEALYHQARSIPAGNARDAWLAEYCGGDAVLLHEVTSLLAAEEAMSAVPAADPAPPPVLPAGPFGVYRPAKLLGYGGMSAVYLAERIDGRFQQQVALKVMAAHLGGEDFLRRFQTEGRVLASLHHPHITSLLDGGVATSGEPFLVLEYVEGQPIDTYCDSRKLNLEARLDVFRQVCEAVDYAHRSLVLHRDLKPANILVTAGGAAKLLDFGTAALMGSEAPVTVTRARMLTPRYASPEQLRGERAGVTSDVFSLGVILYELLTGAWPFGSWKSMVTELRRATGEAAATQPSSAVTEDAAARRSVSRRRLQRVLSGDLSAIVMKALESDPQCRYTTVSEMAGDLSRHRKGLPVEARPQTVFYRVRKLAERRWLSLSAASVFVAGLSAAAIVAVNQARAAREEARKSDEVTRFLTRMLSSASLGRFDPHTYTVGEMLDAAELRLAKGPKQDPRIDAVLHLSLARSFLAMHLGAKAETHLDQAIPELESAGGQPDLADALEVRELTLAELGRNEQAVRDGERALTILYRLGRRAPARLVFAGKNDLGYVLGFLMHTDSTRARRLFEEAIALASNDPSISRVDLAVCMANLGNMLTEGGRFQEGEALLTKALATGRGEDPDGLWQFDVMLRLTAVHDARNDNADAKEVARQMIEVSARSAGPASVECAQSKITWALFAARLGEVDAAVAAVSEAIPVVEKHFSPPSLDLWYSEIRVSGVLRIAKRYAESESYARKSLAVAQTANPDGDFVRLGNSWNALGLVLVQQEKYAEGIDALGHAREFYGRAGGPAVELADAMARRIEAVRKQMK